MAENFSHWLKAERPADVVAGVQKPRAAAHRYKSKHNPDPTLALSSFGPRHVGDEYEYGKRIKVRPTVPKRSERGVAPARTKKNFVMANAVRAILAGAELRRTTQQRDYLRKKNFGKVPAYLDRVKGQIEEETEALRAAQREQERIEREKKAREHELDEGERAELVQRLKDEWDECNRQYQRQAHVVNLDTMGKVRRKETLDKKLKKIEAAIDILRKGPVTVVSEP